MATGKFSVHGDAQTVATAITILELTAPAASSLIITRAWISCNTSTAGSARVRILRKSGTITGTATPPTPVALDGASTASGATLKWLATVEGTDGNVLYEDVMRLDGGGWIWIPVPEERIFVPSSGIVALKFPAAPTSGSYTFGFTYMENV